MTGRLRQQERKITSPRAAILEILRQQAHPLTNKEIHRALPKGGADLATIYRAMQLLQKLGMVKRFDFGDGVARFKLVAEGDEGHHHHLVCARCAAVREIGECFQAEFERRIALAHGFTAVTHRLEFFGLCPDCQK